MVESLIDFIGGNPDVKTVRDAKRAIQAAYRDLANTHNWTYFYTHGRINTVNTQSIGTVSYLQSSGTYPNQATLSGAAWPNWSAGAYLFMGQIRWKVARVVSATVAQLDPQVNPGVDALDATYTLYRDSYVLPEDYVAQDQALYEQNFGGMTYRHPSDWLYENRYIFSSGTPQFYTIKGDQTRPGRLFLCIYPFPVDHRTIDFVYKRRPRNIGAVVESKAGTVSVLLGTTAVTGVGTAFSPSMVGAVIRFSSTPASGAAVVPPTAVTRENPAAFETTIEGYTSPTSLTLNEPAPAAFSGVGYTISDAVDVEVGAMYDAFERGCEAQMGKLRNLDNKSDLDRDYVTALRRAMAADSRSFMGRAEGLALPVRQRLRDMPLGPDQP